jgi:hypothetical protein
MVLHIYTYLGLDGITYILIFVWFVVFDPFFSGESANAVESCPLSMGSLMPLSGVSSAELFVTDTAAVDL